MAFLSGFFLVAFFCPILSAAEINSGGTGVGLGILEHLAAAYADRHPDHRVHVVRPSLGSGGGIKGVGAGRLSLAISARHLKDSERKAGLAEHPLCRTPYVVAVSRANPTEASLSVTDLAAMIRETWKWPDGTRARFIMRPSTDSMTDLLKSISPEVAAAVNEATARPGMVFFETDQDSADAIEKIEGSVGTTALALILAEHRPLKALPLAGVTPDLANLADDRYPYAIDLMVVTRLPPAADVAPFLAFVRSKAAAEVLRDVGCLPTRR